jgi:hypothetical protein
MNRINRNIFGASLIAIFVVLMGATVAAADPWEGYLVPQHSTGNSGEDTMVELWVDYDDTDLTYGAVLYQVDIHFDAGCVDITAADFSASPFGAHMFTPYAPGVVRILEDNFGTMTPIASGTYKMATLTFHGSSASCVSDIWFDENFVSDINAGPIANLYTDGTYTSGDEEPQCLGDCYYNSDCTELMAENVPCYECLGAMGGASWKPTTQCPGRDLQCPDMCFTECPACCDGIDNDGDGLIDCPADDGCACCCDYTETTESPVPCVPELPTFALASIGILGIALLARKRE